MSQSVKALCEKRAEIEVQLNALLADGESREWTAEDESKYEALFADDNKSKAQIERLESVASLGSELDNLRDSAVQLTGRQELGDPELENNALRGWLDSQWDETRQYVNDQSRKAMQAYGIGSGDKGLILNGFMRSFRNDLTTGTGSGDAGNVINQRLIAALQSAFLFYGGLVNHVDVITTANGRDFIFPTFDDTANSGSMVAEAGAAGTASNPTFAKPTLSAYKGSTGILKMTWESIRDTDVDLVPLLGRAFGERLGRLVNNKGTVGTGTAQAEGITVGAAAGGTAAATGAITTDELIDLEHAVDVAHRTGASFMTNDATVKALRKLKDADNQYIWQRPLTAGAPSTLFGYPVITNSDMATMAASAVSVVFGNLKAYKLRMVEQIRVYRLEQLYRANDQDGLVAFNSFDGKIINPGDDPIVKLVQAAS
jgi:HK97 family phage major capsid protein